MDIEMEIFLGLLYLVIFVSVVFFGVVFPFWMFIHGLIRIFRGIGDIAVNILFLVLIFFLPFIGACVYYFVIYRKPHPLIKREYGAL